MSKLKLLMMSTILLACTQAMATIVDGVRQKPEVPKSGFAANTEAYLYNVGSGLYFTEGNSWGTQASVGETGLVIKFTTTATNGVYLFNDYSIVKNGWKEVFFDSETAMFVDRQNQGNYYWEVEENSDGTFRLMPSANNPSINNDIYPEMYVGLNVAENPKQTALSPLLVPGDGHYIDWLLVKKEDLDNMSSQIELYNKAQELKALIDKIKAQNGNASSLEAIYLNEESTMAERWKYRLY